jgi:hypothetical protein
MVHHSAAFGTVPALLSAILEEAFRSPEAFQRAEAAPKWHAR